jgi:Uri superfamily endonuclease
MSEDKHAGLSEVIANTFHYHTDSKRNAYPLKGSYVLLIELAEDQTITVGSLHALCFSRGYYAYVGSAMGGFKPRLNHHLKQNERPRWHIDYLLQKASIVGIMLCETKERAECTIAQALKHRFHSIAGFGSSDCRCGSHLFFAAKERQMKSGVMTVLNLLGYQVWNIGEPLQTTKVGFLLDTVM